MMMMMMMMRDSEVEYVTVRQIANVSLTHHPRVSLSEQGDI